MNIDLFKNPIVLSIIAATLTYLYFWWVEKKRREVEPDIKDQPISIIIPLAIGVIVWFGSATYFDVYDTDSVTNSESLKNNSSSGSNANASTSIGVSLKNKPTITKQAITKSPMAGGSYHFVGKNKIRLPPTDVFLDIAKF